MGDNPFISTAGVEPYVPAFPTSDFWDISFEDLMEGSVSLSHLTHQSFAPGDDVQINDALLDDEETDANKDKPPKAERIKIKLLVKK